MAMQFERAIEEASTLFLFDRRSQQQLQEMAEDAAPRSRDRYLLRLSQAAFAYYNAADAEPENLRGIIRHAMGILREVKQFREDRVFYSMALRLEVDLLMHASALQFQEATGRGLTRALFNEEDARALSICETLLKNFPPSFDPYPNAWYSALLPLFPNYSEEVVRFYKDRIKENRIEVLTVIMRRMREELIVAAGLIRAKQFMAENGVPVRSRGQVNRYLLGNLREVWRMLGDDFPPMVHLVSDITLPRGIGHAQLESAVGNVDGQIEQAREQKDIRRFTSLLLQLGILHFLDENSEETVRALVRTLHATGRISTEDKQLRQYRHEEFPDIPFMIGTAYLRLVLEEDDGGQPIYTRNSVAGLMRALSLQPQYHQAYVNLLVAVHMQGQEAERDALVKLYMGRFGNDLSQINDTAFRNLARLTYLGAGERLTPEAVQWLALSIFCTGGQETKARKMLQELKTLYVLNAHDIAATYLNAYRSAFRLKDEEFIKDLENDELHSALLFYIAHAFGSLSLTAGKQGGDVQIDYDNLQQSIDLNGEALYFNPANGSALRLVDTQTQIIQYGLQRTQKRWENINNMMGQRFNFYEEYLRQLKCLQSLKDRLTELKLNDRLPDLELSGPAQDRMNETVSADQRERIRARVYG